MLSGWPSAKRSIGNLSGSPVARDVTGNLSGLPNIARRLDRLHPINRGLCGWWPIDEMQGTRIRDLSIYGNHGTLTNAASPPSATSGWGAGASQRELSLDGTNDYVLVPHSASLAIVGDITLSCWVNSPFASFGMLICKGASGVCNPYQFFVFGGGASRIIGRGNGAVEAVFYATDSGVPLSTWTHLAVTMSGTTATHYRNGVQGGSGALSTTIGDSGGSLYLGRRGDGYYTQMRMAHARVYNRALSAIESAQLYADKWVGSIGGIT